MRLRFLGIAAVTVYSCSPPAEGQASCEVLFPKPVVCGGAMSFGQSAAAAAML